MHIYFIFTRKIVRERNKDKCFHGDFTKGYWSRFMTQKRKIIMITQMRKEISIDTSIEKNPTTGLFFI